MKRILFTLGLLLGGAMGLSAQDIIKTREGSEIEARIVEITQDEVKYKRFNYLDGPSFVLPTSDIDSIRYENGETEVFEAPRPSYIPYTDSAIMPGMRYGDYKDYYDPHFYVPQPGDPYSRVWLGIASAIIPGLGEMIEGEWGRGLGVLAGNIALGVVQVLDLEYDPQIKQVFPNSALYWVAGFARTALNIWSICDAVRIAKVKNMYYQDLRGTRASIDLKIEPYFAYTPAASNTLQPAAGLSLSLNF